MHEQSPRFKNRLTRESLGKGGTQLEEIRNGLQSFEEEDLFHELSLTPILK